MGGRESKQMNESSDSVSIASAANSLSRQTAKKKKRESTMVVGGSVNTKTLDTKFGLPQDSDLAMPPEEEFLPSFMELLV